MLPSDSKMPGVQRTFLWLVLVLTAIPAWKLFATLPSSEVMMEQLLPAEARAGDVVTVTGYALDAAHVQELYLVDEENTVKTEILAEAGTSLRFRVPAKIRPGSWQLVVKAPARAGLARQMVYLRVLEPAG